MWLRLLSPAYTFNEGRVVAVLKRQGAKEGSEVEIVKSKGYYFVFQYEWFKPLSYFIQDYRRYLEMLDPEMVEEMKQQAVAENI